MSSFRFEDPWALVLALGLFPMIYFGIFRRSVASVKYPTLGLLSQIRNSPIAGVIHVPMILRAAALLLLVTAFARPQLGNRSTEILSEGVDIVLAVDTSGSMIALADEIDTSSQIRIRRLMKSGRLQTRLDAVRTVVKDFLRGRMNDRIGLVVFGDNAFVQCPPTLDHDVLLKFLDNIEVGMAGGSTSIGSAIALSARRLENLPAKDKVIILLTDGSDTGQGLPPRNAAEIARRLGIRVYTIGFGSEVKAQICGQYNIFERELTPIHPRDLFSDSSYLYAIESVDIRENPAYFLDRRTLNDIAEITMAKSFYAADTDMLHSVYEQIDRLEKTEVKVKEYTEYFELFPWLLFPALGIVAIELLLRNTYLRRLP